MNMIEIERALRELRLSGIAETLSTRVMQAQAAQEPFLETFAAMLQDELDRRRSRLTERRFKRSGLDERPSLADFDWRFNPKLPRSACFELHTLKFIGEGANALIIGKPDHATCCSPPHVIEYQGKIVEDLLVADLLRGR